MAGDDPAKEKFTWTIEAFSKLPKKHYSELFSMGGLDWRVLIFPKGNDVDYLSIYVDAADAETKLRCRWKIDAAFSITLVNQIHDKFSLVKDSTHVFNESASDWGFPRFLQLSDLHDLRKGYLLNDTCIIEATVEVKSVFPQKESVKAPSGTQILEQKNKDFDFPTKVEGSGAQSVAQSEEPPNKQIDVSTDVKYLAKAHDKAEEQIRGASCSSSPPTLFHKFGQLKVRNPPYTLPTGCRITEGSVLDDGDLASKLIQSALLSSELKSLVNMPVVELTNQGYYHLTKFLHYHSASMVKAQDLQIKHQEEHVNVLEEVKSRDVEIHQVRLCLEKSTEEASQLRGDLEKVKGDLENVKDEKVKVVAELSAAKEKIMNLEGELKHLYSENVDLQIQLENARQVEQNGATHGA